MGTLLFIILLIVAILIVTGLIMISNTLFGDAFTGSVFVVSVVLCILGLVSIVKSHKVRGESTRQYIKVNQNQQPIYTQKDNAYELTLANDKKLTVKSPKIEHTSITNSKPSVITTKVTKEYTVFGLKTSFIFPKTVKNDVVLNLGKSV